MQHRSTDLHQRVLKRVNNLFENALRGFVLAVLRDGKHFVNWNRNIIYANGKLYKLLLLLRNGTFRMQSYRRTFYVNETSSTAFDLFRRYSVNVSSTSENISPDDSQANFQKLSIEVAHTYRGRYINIASKRIIQIEWDWKKKWWNGTWWQQCRACCLEESKTSFRPNILCQQFGYPTQSKYGMIEFAFVLVDFGFIRVTKSTNNHHQLRAIKFLFVFVATAFVYWTIN